MKFEPFLTAAASASLVALTSVQAYGVLGHTVTVTTGEKPAGDVFIQGNYQTRVLEVPTTFANENNGTWLMKDWDRDGIPDLVFIKTDNTPNGHVEVPTTFANENNGTWLMADWNRDGIPDLVYIKTDNTPNGHVEVHVAPGRTRFDRRVLEVPTTFANENDGTWLMTNWDRDGIPDLVYIKTNNTPNGHVEVHVAAG
ncbi:hypothetical protein BG005_008792 [Podila minutissima]|nr:hypothetical protein BG005_008792 [Podila minutissima]